MDRLLIHPPFADPTQPYLSLPTLKGYLREHGLDARVLDLNVEAVHWLMAPDRVRDLAHHLGTRFLALDKLDELDFEQQREYRALVEARMRIERVIEADPQPIAVLQDAELFYDAERYLWARRQVEDFFAALSAVRYPFVIDSNQLAHGVLPWSYELLQRYAEQGSPLADFYGEVFDGPADWADWQGSPPFASLEDVEFVGISIAFPSQVPEALHLARAVKQRAPHAFVALGGPALHQIAIHAPEELRARLLGFADGLGLFEGEETLRQLFPRLLAWRTATLAGDAAAACAALADVPNLMLRDPATGAIHLGPRHTMDLRDVPPPDYGDLDLDRYLAPSRTLLYAPTRGCYWGKCSFCYYGLTETATAKYREVPPEKAASDLAILAQRYGVKNVYLSVDVLSPRYAVALAEALIERGTKIRWHCDLKVERYFTPERVELLYRSGLRAVAFGIESGNDRVLELMRKGADRATLTEVNRLFHEAGIATQWMTFTDHPGESTDEALETVAWIDAEQEHIDSFLVGRFGLEAGAHVAQEPERYGVKSIYYAEGDDLRLYALFDQRGPKPSPAQRQKVEDAVERVAARYALKSYPWAGAVSTHHTFLHFLRYGQRIFRNHFQRAPAALHQRPPEARPASIHGLRTRPRFDIDEIARNEERFFADYLQRALYTTVGDRRGAGAVALLSEAHYLAAIADLPPLRGGRRSNIHANKLFADEQS
jgi:anaerobic magnesium-protoporphyrin IX monomethyl ester cyclase